MINKDNLSENIRKVALFTLRQKHKVRTFADLEYELEIPKKEIIEIFNLFGKANIFFYELIRTEEEDEDYDLFPSRKRIESQTGAFRLFFTPETGKIIKLEKMLYTPTGSNIPIGIINEKVAKEIIKIESKRDKFIKSKECKKRDEFIKKSLTGLIESPQKRNIFIRKYVKYLDLPIIQDDKKIRVGKLEIDLSTGQFNYYNKKGFLNLKNQEYKTLYVLIESKGYQSSYEEILKIILPNKNHQSKTNRDYLYTIIKNIKKEFNILPKTKKSNPDFFENINGFGYRLKL